MSYDIEELMWEFEETGGITLECGCFVEADGSCPCGNTSPLITLGLI